MSKLILKYERTVEIDGDSIYIDIGSYIPVRREHIAQDPTSHKNRIVKCEVLEVLRCEDTNKCIFRVRADGFSRAPTITVDKIETTWSSGRSGSGSASWSVELPSGNNMRLRERQSRGRTTARAINNNEIEITYISPDPYGNEDSVGNQSTDTVENQPTDDIEMQFTELRSESEEELDHILTQWNNVRANQSTDEEE